MVNKLRFTSLGGGTMLLLATLWATVNYWPDGNLARFVLAGAVAVAVIALPRLIAYAKLVIYNANQWWESRDGYSFERGSIYRSKEAVDDRSQLVDDVTTRLETASNYDGVRRDEFPEGSGLTVTHAGFHNTFFRITRAGQVVVTGASERSRDLADLLESEFGLTMERAAFNPFLEPQPIRGAPRVFLGLFLVAMILVSAGSVGAAVHQTTAYNAAEKVVLVGLDARADMPGVDDDQVRLQKASFIVDIVEEEAVEIQWEQNSSGRIATHAQQSVYASEHAGELLNETLERGDRAERERARGLQTRLRRAEADVASAIEERNTGNVTSDDLSRMRKVLENRSTTASG